MKSWTAYGSEHSMNLMMIGHFADHVTAQQVKSILERLITQTNTDITEGKIEPGEKIDRYSDTMLDTLSEVNVYGIPPQAIEQFSYDVSLDVSENDVFIKTDESEVLAFLITLIEKGAKVEVFSLHDHPHLITKD